MNDENSNDENRIVHFRNNNTEIDDHAPMSRPVLPLTLDDRHRRDDGHPENEHAQSTMRLSCFSVGGRPLGGRQIADILKLNFAKPSRFR